MCLDPANTNRIDNLKQFKIDLVRFIRKWKTEETPPATNQNPGKFKFPRSMKEVDELSWPKEDWGRLGLGDLFCNTDDNIHNGSSSSSSNATRVITLPSGLKRSINDVETSVEMEEIVSAPPVSTLLSDCTDNSLLTVYLPNENYNNDLTEQRAHYWRG